MKHKDVFLVTARVAISTAGHLWSLPWTIKAPHRLWSLSLKVLVSLYSANDGGSKCPWAKPGWSFFTASAFHGSLTRPNLRGDRELGLRPALMGSEDVRPFLFWAAKEREEEKAAPFPKSPVNAA